MKFNLLFESTPSDNYVGVLADTSLVAGLIASQNAGSVGGGMYYQVDGDGVNGLFRRALGALAPSINSDLEVAYDARFGKGAWKKDKTSKTPPLTSFYIPLPADAADVGHNVGGNVVGMVYSVGPFIDVDHVPDRDLYRQIYVDALNELAGVNKSAASKIEGLRITMLSTGFYGPPPGPIKTALCQDVAGVILEVIEAASKSPAAASLPTTFLINCKTDPNATPASMEIDAFTTAAKARGITVTRAGFELDC